MSETQEKLFTKLTKAQHELAESQTRVADLEALLSEYQSNPGALLDSEGLERKRALEEIQSLAKFPSENPNPVLRVASDGTLLYANPGSSLLLTLWGCEVGTRIPDNIQGVVSESFAAGTRRQIEVICDDVNYSLIFTPIVDAGYTNIYGRDITVRILTQKELGASEVRYRRLFEAAQDGILILDANTGQVVDANPFLLDLLGYSVDQLLGKELWELGLFKDIASSQESFRELQGKGYIRYEDLPLETQHGRHIQVEFVSNIYLVNDEKVIQCNIRDITQRKRAEEVLRRYAERLAAINRLDRIIASSLEIDLFYNNFVKELLAVVPVDRTSIILLNEAGDQWQVARQWARHKPMTMPGDWRPVKGSVIEWLVTNRVPFSEPKIGELETWPETELIRREGMRSHLLFPLIIQERIVGAISVASHQLAAFSEEDQSFLAPLADQLAIAIQNVNLYEQVQRHAAELEQRVLQRTAQLEAANKELEAFSYSVSHDLRAPLRGIDGYARILLRDYAPLVPEDGQRRLQSMRDMAQHMGKLIDDLLTFSRLNRQSLQKQSVDVSALAKQVLEELQGEVGQRQVEIVVGELPHCQADRSLLKQVFTNLLSNALKYTRPREVARIEVGTIDYGGTLAYFVRDNGVGFDMQYVDKLFGVFQRLHSADEFEGTGVGLAIVQRIINRHGGHVWAESALDTGASFFFTLEGDSTDDGR